MKSIFKICIALAILSMACSKENDSEKTPQTQLSGTWRVDSLVISNYVDNNLQMRSVQISNPHRLIFDIPGKVIEQKFSTRDTFPFSQISANLAVTNIFDEEKSDTIQINHTQLNEITTLECVLWSAVYDSSSHKNIGTLYISR